METQQKNSIEVSDNYSRFKDANWFKKEGDREHIFILGQGGIGSWTALLAGRAGFNLVLVDNDRIETHNLSGQFFKNTDIDKLKIEAVKENIKEFCSPDVRITTINDRVDEKFMTHHLMITAFDNMKARKEAFNVWKKSWENAPIPPLLIDGRLRAEQFQIICVTKENAEEYEKTYLFDDDFEDADAIEESCTLKQTSHTAAMIAGHIVGFLTNHLSNVYSGMNIRSLPFFYEYLISMNYTEIK